MSKITKEGSTVVIKPAQDLVASTVKELKEEMKQALTNGAVEMVIDLSNVEMMDSMGIGILIAAHNSLQKKGSQLKLIDPSEDILKLLKNMRLDKHFII